MPHSLTQANDNIIPQPLPHSVSYFFLLPPLRIGAPAHGAPFSPSTFPASTSIVNKKGLWLKLIGTPSQWNSVPASGFPLSGLSSFSGVSAVSGWAASGNGTATSSSLGRHAGLAATSVPRSCGTAEPLSCA